MGTDFGRLAWAAVFVAAVAGCGGDDEAAEPPAWDSCERAADGCTCVMREGGSTQEFPPADDCSGYDCCLLSRDEAGSSASCRCFDTTESCEDVAEAASSMVVAQCPPPGELLSTRAMCIPEGSGCPNRSLDVEDEGSGCCEGLLCLSDGKTDAHDVCQAVGERDPDLAEQCERATLLGSEELDLVGATLATDRGTLRFHAARSTIASVGPGCIKQLNMAFTGGSGDGGACELVLDAVLFEGEWVVRRVLASLEACEGYSGSDSGTFDVRDAAEIPFAFTHTTEECGARDKHGEHCVVGTFDWQLSGELGGVSFEGSHLIAEGVVCSHASDDSCDEI